jgi:Translation machinery associated TMA7
MYSHEWSSRWKAQASQGDQNCTRLSRRRKGPDEEDIAFKKKQKEEAATRKAAQQSGRRLAYYLIEKRIEEDCDRVFIES